jgi:hypothetical protein
MSQAPATDRRWRPAGVEFAFGGLRLAGIGLVAIGISGILAFGLGLVAGRAFISGGPPGVAYSVPTCRDFLEDAPHARSCAEAAAKEHFSGVIAVRIAAGVLGVALLAGAALLRRRRRQPPESSSARLPEVLVPTIATLAFSGVGVWLVAHGIDLTLGNADSGGGGFLSLGIVALVMAVWFSVALIRV